MYSSRGGNAYGQQQPYASQSAYSQSMGTAYSGGAVGGPDGGSRHSSMLGGAQESDITGYRGHSSAGAHYGGQYSSVYGSATLSSGQQSYQRRQKHKQIDKFALINNTRRSGRGRC